MIQIKKTILTLALLITAVTGAWAESKPIGLNVEYAVGDVITSTTDVYVYYGEHPTNHKQMAVKITSTGPLTISMIFDDSFGFNGDDAVYYLPDGEATGGSAGFIPCVGESTGDATVVHVASGTGTLTDPYVFGSGPFGTPVPLTRGTGEKINEWTLTNGMPAGNVTVSVEYYPQAALTAAPTAINDVPATTDGAIVKAGTVANIGTTETAQGTVMYYVSPTALDDAALLALDADKWTADVPTAEKLAQGKAYVYYYVRGNDSDTDEENFSDGDILAANALQVTLGAAPLWNAEFDLTDAPEADKTGKWSTNIPEGGVTKGQTVTVTYTGSKKVIGVKAEKKAAAPASTPLDNTTTAWSAGTYAVPAGGLTYSDAITVSGDVTLVLTDGETLTLNKGISLASGATLTIQGNGTMNVNGTNGNSSSTVAGTGTLVLTSGTLNATGGNGHVGNDLGQFGMNGGISHGGSAINGSLTLEGGNVTATGGNGGNAGGSGINWATGGNGGSAITGNVIINGGNWTANNGSNGTLLSGGSNNKAGSGGKAVAGTVTDNR